MSRSTKTGRIKGTIKQKRKQVNASRQTTTALCVIRVYDVVSFLRAANRSLAGALCSIFDLCAADISPSDNP